MMMRINKKKNSSFRVEGSLFEIDSKYEPIDSIGKGSYGIVCSCRNTDTNEKVAIKKISDVFSSQVDALRTLRELIILRNIRHHNVVQLKDVMITCSKSTFKEVYAVYEFMDSDLHQIIQSPQPLSPEHCQYFMFQLLEGVKYLHLTNIIHRDLKPANLLINANCNMKICDFGLARTSGGDGGEFMTEYVVTRWYRAPELLICRNSYDTSIDVWSVGCIFAEILLRRPLFPGHNPLDQLKRVIDFLGSPTESDLDFLDNPKAINFIKGLPRTKGVCWKAMFPEADSLALDLLQRMLVFNPKKRITIADALQHPYMFDLYNPTEYPPSHKTLDVNIDAYVGETNLRDMLWSEMLFYK
ncbi:mitogen-activated protein kinase 7-like [Spinacia oleracea]|uniref:Mitogen-activated protein kinase n=1 Tax=Spinacia oleracea TaxID=3562 RepID=A0ABM3RKF3_SPIOL|nr:mitogen-activated protein kinase 7-like [Spinacia oleracea]XP_056696092.1 mitogen-activated protein kinase 7-like [Spinacia oleracea]